MTYSITVSEQCLQRLEHRMGLELRIVSLTQLDLGLVRLVVECTPCAWTCMCLLVDQ